MSVPFTILILTEDASKSGWDVIRHIVKKSLQEVDPLAVVWPEDRWIRPSNQTALASRGSFWKSTSEQYQAARRELIRSVTTHLLRTNGFVMFHFDGDEPWSRRNLSENIQKWAEFRQLVEQQIRQTRDKEVTNGAMNRLLRLTPFYCIEAWLYLAKPSLLEICAREHNGIHLNEINTQGTLAKGIEEIVKPWEKWCVGKEANLELAPKFPAREAYELEQSFYETVEQLMACNDLIEALKTSRTWGSSSHGEP